VGSAIGDGWMGSVWPKSFRNYQVTIPIPLLPTPSPDSCGVTVGRLRGAEDSLSRDRLHAVYSRPIHVADLDSPGYGRHRPVGSVCVFNPRSSRGRVLAGDVLSRVPRTRPRDLDPDDWAENVEGLETVAEQPPDAFNTDSWAAEALPRPSETVQCGADGRSQRRTLSPLHPG
jgi:hypothetical protein